jgi:hypothetical protein
MLGADEGALMARSPIDEVADVVKDAAYVSVGLGVIAFQRLQVRRNDLSKALSGRGTDAAGPLGLVSTLVGERIKVVEERLGAIRERK